MAKEFETHIKTVQVWEACQRPTPAQQIILKLEHVRCKSFCKVCFDSKHVCEACKEKGHSYIPSLRCCYHCLDNGLICRHSVVAPAGFWPRGQNLRRQNWTPRVIMGNYCIRATQGIVGKTQYLHKHGRRARWSWEKLNFSCAIHPGVHVSWLLAWGTLVYVLDYLLSIQGMLFAFISDYWIHFMC